MAFILVPGHSEVVGSGIKLVNVCRRVFIGPFS